MSRIEEIQEQMAALQEELKKETLQLLQEGFAEIFQSQPDLDSIAWYQYTPYWNNGDHCRFSLHTDCLFLNDEYAEDMEMPWADEVYQKAYDLLSSITSETFLALFGDHSKVTVYRDEIVIEDYKNHE